MANRRVARRFALGALFAGTVAAAAYRARALDAAGSVAAAAVGTLTFGSLALPGASVLLTFFVTSVALSKAGKERKRALLADVEKQGTRDAAQVLANGGVASLCALLALTGNVRFVHAFAGALAAATADTWGTEIGTLAKRAPVSILTLRPVATGLSGGVTILGSAGQCAGAAVLAVVARVVLKRTAFASIAGAGIAGALVDSLLGASLQTLRWCPRCERATELERHACGTHTTARRGLAFVGNDAVNFAATTAGACIAYALAPP